MRAVAVHVAVLVFGAVALVLAMSMKTVGVRIQTIAFVVLLAAVAWCGRRRGVLGPVADHRSARRVRAVSYVVLGVCVMSSLASFAAASAQHDQSGVWVFYVAVTMYFATALLVTARGAAVPPRTLDLMAAVTVAGLVVWWVAMLLARSVRADPSWALVSVAATVAMSLVIAAVRRWPSEQAVSGMLATAVATCLLIFIAAQSTFRLNPALAPDLGRVPGMTAAAEVEQNHAEAVDPYLTELLLGAMLGALLIGATTLSRRPRVDGHVPAR